MHKVIYSVRQLRDFLNTVPDELLDVHMIGATYSEDVESGDIEISITAEGCQIVGSEDDV